MLQRAATELLERLQEVTDRLRADGGTPHLTVTTTSGFASLWLIPRLRGFTALHPDVDVRISATYKTVNLERSLVDVAVRYCRSEDGAGGRDPAVRRGAVSGLQPGCCRSEGDRVPCARSQDLEHHALLHMDEASGTWIGARGWRRRAAPISSPRRRCGSTATSR